MIWEILIGIVVYVFWKLESFLPVIYYSMFHIEGPFPKPIVGNLPLMKHLPWRKFSELSKRYGGIIGLELGSVPAIIISDPEIVKEALITKGHFNSRKLLRRVEYGLSQGNDVVHHAYDERWKSLRTSSYAYKDGCYGQRTYYK